MSYYATYIILTTLIVAYMYAAMEGIIRQFTLYALWHSNFHFTFAKVNLMLDFGYFQDLVYFVSLKL